jgi:hypothetical protein
MVIAIWFAISIFILIAMLKSMFSFGIKIGYEVGQKADEIMKLDENLREPAIKYYVNKAFKKHLKRNK